MPESRVRDADELYLRKSHWREPHVRFSSGKSDFATAGGAASNAEVARDRQDGFTATVYFQERTAIQGIPCGQRWRYRFRVRTAPCQIKKGSDERGTQR